MSIGRWVGKRRKWIHTLGGSGRGEGRVAVETEVEKYKDLDELEGPCKRRK